LILSILALSQTKQVYAEGEFRTDYDVDFSVTPAGVTIVTQNVTLTNKLTNLYPKEFSVKLDTQAIQNVIAFDKDGQLHPVTKLIDGKTEIRIAFSDQVVGLGKQQSFTIRYENTEIAQKNGSIWEINIPGIVDSKDLGAYNVAVHVPEDFGKLAYMTPLPAKGSKWTKEQMIAGGISAAYGESQRFTVSTVYKLENSSSLTRLTEIALPPDTAYQKVVISEIDPKPANVVRDEDGNWLARYEIAAHDKIQVKAVMVISISLTPVSDFEKQKIDPGKYLKATKNWNSQFPSVTTLAKQYKTPRDIYDYVVRNFVYDYDRVNQNPTRKGAVEAIKDPAHSVCMEFTDAFVAIARAAGIPARQAVGYAYTTNTKLRPLSLVTDVLHAWPEYYDQDAGHWIGIDPTWANTTGGVDYFDKLDFNHIVFAYNGIRDDYPYPAGSYKPDGETNKMINVAFADPAVPSAAKAEIEAAISLPGTVFAGIPANGKLIVHNISGMSVNNLKIKVTSDPPVINFDNRIDYLLPYASQTIPFTYKQTSLLTSGAGHVYASVNDINTEIQFVTRPIYLILAILIVIVIFIFIILWLIIFRKRKK
jgi:transglutaminase-like putative cysteine protease